MDEFSMEICYLYPALMNLYGDRGNVIALIRRCEWFGLKVSVKQLGLGEVPDGFDPDVVFLGGGQDREQLIIGEDLCKYKQSWLHQLRDKGAVIFAVCGGYQLLGRYYVTSNGVQVPGVGLLDLVTETGQGRLIGNVVAESSLDGKLQTLVGFENHSGRTYLGSGVMPLARVIIGNGNNGTDKTEGAVCQNVIGTYLHGSVLPKNPWLADFIIKSGLQRKYGPVDLPAIDDGLELLAHEAAVARARS